jgi:hypothetical protein
LVRPSSSLFLLIDPALNVRGTQIQSFNRSLSNAGCKFHSNDGELPFLDREFADPSWWNAAEAMRLTGAEWWHKVTAKTETPVQEEKCLGEPGEPRCENRKKMPSIGASS